MMKIGTGTVLTVVMMMLTIISLRQKSVNAYASITANTRTITPLSSLSNRNKLPSLSLLQQSSSMTLSKRSTSTSLYGRRWNFNEGQSPWGMKQNAETWNGRFAQMAFTIVLLQELIQGKGVIQGIQEGDPINLAMVGFFAVSLVGLTGWLALQGDDDFMKSSK